MVRKLPNFAQWWVSLRQNATVPIIPCLHESAAVRMIAASAMVRSTHSQGARLLSLVDTASSVVCDVAIEVVKRE